MATTLEAEVMWRMVQGLSGAPLVPLGQMLAVNALPGRHTQATSLWAIGFIAANVISPTLAGYLIESYGWPRAFCFTCLRCTRALPKTRLSRVSCSSTGTSCSG